MTTLKLAMFLMVSFVVSMTLCQKGSCNDPVADMYGIALNPGETLLSVNGSPVAHLHRSSAYHIHRAARPAPVRAAVGATIKVAVLPVKAVSKVVSGTVYGVVGSVRKANTCRRLANGGYSCR